MSEWKCPYCERPFLAGAVTINGDRFYCSHCKCWFKEENENFIQIEYIEVNKF